MQISDLITNEIKNVFYPNVFGGVEFIEKSKEFHLIEDGIILLEFTDGMFVEILVDNEKEGIVCNENNEDSKENILENKVHNDKLWSNISNMTIAQVETYKGFLQIESEGKSFEKEIVSTIELIFKHGERLFISNAGFAEDGSIIELTDDFIVYGKRSLGKKFNLI